MATKAHKLLLTTENPRAGRRLTIGAVNRTGKHEGQGKKGNGHEIIENSDVNVLLDHDGKNSQR